MKLTIKQKKFADEYIISGNATDAAIRAGYSEKTARSIGNENLTKPDISKYIQKRIDEIDSEKIVDQKEIMEYLSLVLRGQEGDQIVVEEGVFNLKASTRDRLKASELLMKRYGMLTEKLDITSENVVIIDDL